MTGVAKQGRRGSGERRRRGVSTRVRDAIAQLIADKDMDIPKAAEAVGMTPASLRNGLQSPAGRAYYLKAVRSITDGSALKAARTLDELISDASSEYVRVDAAKFTLDRVLPRPDARTPVMSGQGINITINTRPDATPFYIVEHADRNMAEIIYQGGGKSIVSLADAERYRAMPGHRPAANVAPQPIPISEETA